MPVTFQCIQGYDKLVPVVPVPEAVDLFVRVTQYGDRVYKAAFKRDFNLLNSFCAPNSHSLGGKPGGAVVCWNGGGHPPSSEGRLVTPMTHLQSSEEFVNFVKHRFMVAEQIRTNPPIVSQNKQKKNNDLEGVAWGVDTDTLRLAEEQKLERLEDMAFQHHTLHCKWGNSGLPSGAAEKNNFLADTRPHEYFVAEERETTRVDLPTSVNTLPDIIRWSEEKIYQIFGMPSGMFTNTGAHIQSNKMQEFSMNRNINRYRTTIQQFLNDIFTVSRTLSDKHTDTMAGGNSWNSKQKQGDDCDENASPNKKFKRVRA